MLVRNVDCLIVGGGPAGLTAAIYLARFHLSVIVIDDGKGRALTIPMTRNHAGFPQGIAGVELVGRMRDQATTFGAILIEGRVSALSHQASGLAATGENFHVNARAVLLATGVVNRRPAMPEALHAAALAAGLLRYCPICDGFEMTDRRIGVIGTGVNGCREALFLRSFTNDVTLIAPEGEHALEPGQRDELVSAAITLVDGPAQVKAVSGETILVATAREMLAFDTLYPALGSDVQSALATDLGIDTSDAGCLIVDAHQRTSIAGFYAAGDVVLGLDQISHAMGEGGVAATAIRNDLAAQIPRWR